ncbi:MAG: beta-ketoacyl-ACP synthase II [Candidatus Promineifilaceae bacterium]|nr:beta-ketoacyl-ACP synthase II [Candidatus Promineifilaceae bacterium]
MNNNSRPRVVVTGVGVVSPLGNTAKENWDSLLTGRSGIKAIAQFDSSHLPVHIAGEVRNFNPADYMNFKEARRMSRGSQLAIAATRMALEDAGLATPLSNGERVATVMGTGAGGLEVADREITALRSKGFNRVSPFAMVGFLPNMPAYHVSLLAGAKGPISTVAAACASGTQAVGEALDVIRSGRADMAIAGGVEGLVHESSIAGFAAMRALSTRNDEPERASRPFDLDRDGTVMSEGAGILVLERLEHALARGATIYAEIRGYASSSDAFHISQPDPLAAGAIRAMRWSLEDADVSTCQIDYINAHGTSTPLNDATETYAIKTLFGEQAYEIPVSASKSVLGHAMGASGAIEAIFCTYALHHGIIPPTWNYETPDPDCDLDYVPNAPRESPLQYVLTNSFGMGGQNACLVLGKLNGEV